MLNLEWNLNELFQEEQDFYEKIKKRDIDFFIL